MDKVLGPMTFPVFLLVTALFYNVPLLLIVLLARRRLAPMVARALLAAGFAAANIFTIWRMEWFDVWRHGMPSISYMVMAHVPYAAALGAVGWGLGAVIVPRPRGASRRSVGQHSCANASFKRTFCRNQSRGGS